MHGLGGLIRGNNLKRMQNDNKIFKKIDEFWKPKLKAGCNIEIKNHMAIIASKSKIMGQLF